MLGLILIPLLSVPLAAQGVGQAKRGTLRVLIHTGGTVRTEDVFQISSSIEGRVEEVRPKPYFWATGRTAIGYVLNQELSALMDSRQTTPSQILEERWQRMYKPTPIRCPGTCFVLKIFARPTKWVKPGALLAEAASRLRLVGRVRPGDTHWIRDGQILTFWAKNDPKKRLQGRVEQFKLDVQGELIEPGGTFTCLLDERHYLEPETEWEGEITALVRKDVLRVPTEALISFNGETFLPVRVSTGITTYDETEISSGITERSRFLILSTASVSSVGFHRPSGTARPPEAVLPEDTAPRARGAGRQPQGAPVGPGTRDNERGAARPKKSTPSQIDAFPEDSEVSRDERYPSDIDAD
ncbi:MAG: hypothetical protein A2X36_12295 [Elusimicrobia bacterium GWA2_69_24]|nr:MAG: hypothetical protein A2X36_12295 [Elusimicrobia bacterium GWA2_69_24]HBL17751.1 hypothetical protein [Elusimicrobiota bacterium]